jgi:hypothetical protein
MQDCDSVPAIRRAPSRAGAAPRRLVHRIRRGTRPLWRSSDRACVVVGLVTFLACAAVSVALGPPPPSIHDEFSYLLAGDTFAHGRLTNPMHALWEHFESFHVLSRPTYASKYQPAPGLFLAVGQVLSGIPVVGVWLSLGLAAGGVCWMLRAWLPAGWSFFGALLLAASPLVTVRWGDSYWGGGVPLLGGALTLGAAGRLCRAARGRDGLLLGLGLVLLALSRPLEGALASVPALVMLVVCRWRSRRSPDPGWRRAVLAFALVAGLGAAFDLYYNRCVTGSAWSAPYTAYRREYSNLPLLAWGPLGVHRVYRHLAFDRFFREYAEGLYYRNITASNAWRLKLALLGEFVFRPFIGFSFVVPLLLSLHRPRSVVVVCLATCLLVAAGNGMYYWVFAHYFAPAGAAVVLAITLGLRRLMALRRLGAAAALVVLASAAVEGGLNHRAELVASIEKRQHFAGMRARLEEQLRLRPGLDLVVVRYERGHDVHEEWVYNGADIDASPVVWAREMDEARNRRLFDHFEGRLIWLLVVGKEPIGFRLHPGVGPSAAGPRSGEGAAVAGRR